MVVEARSTTLDSLIDPAAELTCLGGGFEFTEGPVWSPAEGCLYFSDIPSDTRWRWSESHGMELVMRPCFKANGLVLDRDGNLLVCEQREQLRRPLHAGRRAASSSPTTTRAST